MSNTSEISIYESTFAPSSKTDAILVLDGKKLHVNKGILSYHSDYFKTLFNSDFAEKSMSEIPIKDVNFEDFATLLSLVHEKPIMPTAYNAEKLLELAEQFLLPDTKHYMEMILISSKKDAIEKVRIADKYQLNNLHENGMSLFNSTQTFKNLKKCPSYQNLTAKTKVKLFYRLLKFI